MNFCEKCDNLYSFISTVDDEGNRTMSLRCQACGNQSLIQPNTQIYARQYVSRTQDMPIDPDTQYDHTLSRTSLVSCLNPECPTHAVLIGGAVAKPGVYPLTQVKGKKTQNRLEDVLRLAGGPTQDADLSFLDLASLVPDGARIYVPSSSLSLTTATQTTQNKEIPRDFLRSTQPAQPEVATYQYNDENGMLGYTCNICHHYWKNL